jgi:chromate reductase
MTVKILAFDGSGRSGSVNHKLLTAGIAALKNEGASVTEINLHEMNLPLYDGDLEATQGHPDSVKKLKALFNSHDGFLIASPEYNGGVSGLLKNAIDWVSRQAEGEGMYPGLRGKTAALMSAAPGKLGGMRGLIQLNTILFGVGTLVLPEIVSIGHYKDAFEGDTLKNEADKKAVAAQAARLVKIIRAAG